MDSFAFAPLLKQSPARQISAGGPIAPPRPLSRHHSLQTFPNGGEEASLSASLYTLSLGDPFLSRSVTQESSATNGLSSTTETSRPLNLKFGPPSHLFFAHSKTWSETGPSRASTVDSTAKFEPISTAPKDYSGFQRVARQSSGIRLTPSSSSEKSVSRSPIPDVKRVSQSAPAPEKTQSNESESLTSYFKTNLCRAYSASGTCTYGSKCRFAHGYEELRPLPASVKVEMSLQYKTELCHSFKETNYCRYGIRCQFAHGTAELRQARPAQPKTSNRCHRFFKDGTCPFGTRCKYSHDLKNPGQANITSSTEAQVQLDRKTSDSVLPDSQPFVTYQPQPHSQ